MKRKVKKFGAGGDIATAVGAVLVGKALYDKYKEGKDDSDYARKVKEFRTSKEDTAKPAEEAKATTKAEPKEETREEYLAKKVKPIKETGTFAGPDTTEPDLDRKDKKPVVKKAAPAAQSTKTEPRVKATDKPVKLESQGSFKFDEPKSKPYPKDVKGTEKDPYLTSGGARNRAGMLVNPNFVAPKQASEEEVSEARAALAKKRAEQRRSFEESPLMKAISGGGSRADFYRKKREQEDAERGMKKGGKVKKYASGGSVSSASKRADGIAQRGKTRGRIC